jgi:hypothetical protein
VKTRKQDTKGHVSGSPIFVLEVFKEKLQTWIWAIPK